MTVDYPTHPVPKGVKANESEGYKIEPCDAPDDYRWENNQRTGRTLSRGILNFESKCRVLAESPRAAKNKNISGWTTISVLVDYDGRVIRAKAEQGHPLLRREAIRPLIKRDFRRN